jgi:hypothetical protein
MGLIKKIWHGFLDAIAWITQDNKRLYKAKHEAKLEREITIALLRSRIGKF